MTTPSGPLGADDPTHRFDATATVWDREATEETVRGITVAQPGEPLLIGPVIGVGATSEVREARQQVLDRTVAVKQPKRRPVTNVMAQRLLQEAFVTGALEHPSIVPVHDIQFDKNAPAIVMKHLEGVQWKAVIDDPAAVFEGVDDPLDWNLRVLLRVCEAVEYAHSRGVVHRDLKPENVMIGHFGEVWVLDWGLAVALEDRFSGRVPLAADQKGLAGTPAYMAPEMAQGDGRNLTVQTDIYLLGGILHRIVAKRPPRTGDSLGGLMAAVQWEEVAIDPSWPLADLLVLALHRSPDNRPVSVAAFARGIRHHLQRREIVALVQAGEAALAELIREAEAEDADRFALYDHFGACRFAFEQALARWPDAPGARDGLRTALLTMAQYELANEDDRSASVFVQQLDDPDDLAAEVARLAEGRRRAEAELQKLQEDVDPLTATRPRVISAFAAAFVWVGPPVIAALLGIQHGYPREAFITGATTALTAVWAVVFWKFIFRSRINRVLVAVVALSPLLASILLLACWLAGVPDASAVALRTFAFVCMTAVAAVLADVRLIPGALFFTAMLLLGAARPNLASIALALANLFLIINAVLIWFPASIGLTKR